MSSFVGSCSRLAQPALSPRCPRRGWLTAGAASQRGTASSVERSAHEAAVRGRRRGRGLGVLLRAAATVRAGARQAGRRDQHRPLRQSGTTSRKPIGLRLLRLLRPFGIITCHPERLPVTGVGRPRIVKL